MAVPTRTSVVDNSFMKCTTQDDAPSSANECTTSTSHVLDVEFIVNRVFEPSPVSIVQRSLQLDRSQFALPEPAALLEHLLALCSRARVMLW